MKRKILLMLCMDSVHFSVEMPIEYFWPQDRLYPLVPDCREEKILALSQKVVKLLHICTFALSQKVELFCFCT